MKPDFEENSDLFFSFKFSQRVALENGKIGRIFCEEIIKQDILVWICGSVLKTLPSGRGANIELFVSLAAIFQRDAIHFSLIRSNDVGRYLYCILINLTRKMIDVWTRTQVRHLLLLCAKKRNPRNEFLNFSSILAISLFLAFSILQSSLRADCIGLSQ